MLLLANVILAHATLSFSLPMLSLPVLSTVAGNLGPKNLFEAVLELIHSLSELGTALHSIRNIEALVSI